MEEEDNFQYFDKDDRHKRFKTNNFKKRTNLKEAKHRED